MTPETVIGYHACPREFALKIEAGELRVENWRPSRNEYDWLGHGIYFWEGNLRRAKQWAVEAVVGDAAVIEAEITLGMCLEPTVDYQELFPIVYARLAKQYERRGWPLPTNRGRGCKLRELDCLVINEFLQVMAKGGSMPPIDFQTVRCPFEEGEPIFPGSMIRQQSHVQISVRDNNCIRVRNVVSIDGGNP